MAFLDNSGDIILDTVLTEIGRKRMATGNFKITKFALGDDEIDYNLYNKNHSSGSAYYDLEILQTPVFQSSTGVNANINYGLLSYRNANLLYLPNIKRNNLITNSVAMRDNVFYLAVDDGQVTYDALMTAFGGVQGGGSRQLLKSGDMNGPVICIETGIDNADILATPENRQTYIVGQGLVDTGFQISLDRRFFTAVLGPSGQATFNNQGNFGAANIRTTLTSNTITSVNNQLGENYGMSQIRALQNNVTYSAGNNTSDTSISVIAGPRSAVTFINFTALDISTSDFSKHGKTGQTISGAAGTYKYIDTMVTILGSTGTQDQIPIRIIKKE